MEFSFYFLCTFIILEMRELLFFKFCFVQCFFFACSLNALTPISDMDRTVSRRSESKTCIVLMGEQPNSWNILQPQVTKSRDAIGEDHRVIPRVTFIH